VPGYAKAHVPTPAGAGPDAPQSFGLSAQLIGRTAEPATQNRKSGALTLDAD
jgi:hypothetical protein